MNKNKRGKRKYKTLQQWHKHVYGNAFGGWTCKQYGCLAVYAKYKARKLREKA